MLTYISIHSPTHTHIYIYIIVKYIRLASLSLYNIRACIYAYLMRFVIMQYAYVVVIIVYIHSTCAHVLDIVSRDNDLETFNAHDFKIIKFMREKYV